MSTLVPILLAIVMQLLGYHPAIKKTALTTQKLEVSITKKCDSFTIKKKDTAVYCIYQSSKNEQLLNENNAL